MWSAADALVLLRSAARLSGSGQLHEELSQLTDLILVHRRPTVLTLLDEVPQTHRAQELRERESVRPRQRESVCVRESETETKRECVCVCVCVCV